MNKICIKAVTKIRGYKKNYLLSLVNDESN